MAKNNLLFYAGLTALLFFLFGYILFPALKTVETSVLIDGSVSFVHYTNLFTVDLFRAPLVHSVVLGLLSVLVCGFVGITLAFLLHFFDFPLRNLLDKLLLLPMVMPGIIIVYAFVQLYGESGMVTKAIQLACNLDQPPFRLSGLTGILFVHAYTQYVYFYLTVSLAIKHIDLSVIESARSLGASRTKVFFSIILPYLKPAILAACAMTFISGAGSFTAPSIIGGSYKVITTQILLSKANNYMDIAATQVSVLTCISLLFFAVFRMYEAKKQFISSVKGVQFQPIQLKKPALRFLLIAGVLFIIFTILLPIFTIILVSLVPSSSWMINYFPKQFTLHNYTDIFTNSRKIQPFLNSSIMALGAAAFGLLIGIPSSAIIIKGRQKMKWLVEFLVMLPWAIPASAIAINIINAFNEPSIFSFNTVLVGTSVLLPLGYFVRSLPILVKTLNVSFQNLNDTYLDASKSLGATSLQTYKNIAIPILSSGIIAAFLLVFIRSVGEYTVSVFLYNASNKPMSIAMVNSVFEYNIGLGMAYGSLLILLTLVLSLIISKGLAVSVR
ncbi:ABC transporter permease [Desulforhopalus sp. 52FAK]